MIKQFFIFFIALAISSESLAQTSPIDPATLNLLWGIASITILQKVNDPLIKEIIIKAGPKIINQDAKGAAFEITDAIYRIKKVKVGNKEFLSQLEIDVNQAIKSIKSNDIPNAANSLLKTASYTEMYLKSGILDKPEPKSQVPLASVSPPVVITKADINNKVHYGKNNNYFFFTPKGTLTEEGKNSSTQSAEEAFLIEQTDGKSYNLAVEDNNSTNLKEISVESIQSNKEKETKFNDSIAKTLSTNLGSGQIIKSEIANYNFKVLKYTYKYTDKATSLSSMAMVIIAFKKSTMFLITFKTSEYDFPETKKLFEDFMEDFYLI